MSNILETNIFESKQVLHKSKITIYKGVLSDQLLCTRVKHDVKGDGDKTATFKRIYYTYYTSYVLKMIYGSKRNNVAQQYEVNGCIELRELYKKPDAVTILRYRRIALAGHSWRSDSLMKAVLKRKSRGKRPLGRPEHRRTDDVKKNSTGIGDMGQRKISAGQR